MFSCLSSILPARYATTMPDPHPEYVDPKAGTPILEELGWEEKPKDEQLNLLKEEYVRVSAEITEHEEMIDRRLVFEKEAVLQAEEAHSEDAVEMRRKYEHLREVYIGKGFYEGLRSRLRRIEEAYAELTGDEEVSLKELKELV